MKLSDANLVNERAAAAAEWLGQAFRQNNIDISNLEQAFTEFTESDPLDFAYEDAGASAKSKLMMCLFNAGFDSVESDKIMKILEGLLDPFGDLIGGITHAIGIV